ncbi:MAG TPA: Mur ligase family protein [Candidatus Saccharibacteria bacterium]|nr:Mur ligase family protein [Candidatus Saccharibacteria bacterium]HMR38059.1 Mur ligase family protein [Candidatus Saccharibacteria bacterium]
MIADFAQAEEALRHYIDYNSGVYTTETTKRLAEHMGSPEEQLRVIHVAGTSGKTSTCYYLRELLEAAGKKTGLTVSPHIVTIADRVQVGGQPLSETDFCRYFSEFYQKLQTFDGQPSYFEVMMVFALWVFQQEQVDYAVIETGLGGLHDSSNICRRPDKLCILTDIGFDHMAVLGDSLADIATQKVGIVAPDNQLISYPQPAEAMRIIQEKSPKTDIIAPPVTIDYRERNFHLAYSAYQWLARRDDLPELSNEKLQRCRTVQVPGRLDVFMRNGTTIVLDGAHNYQKMAALVQSFSAQFTGQKPVVVLAMKQGKEFKEVIELLQPLTTRIITTEYQTFQDTRLGAISADILAEECTRIGMPVQIEKDIVRALDTAEKQSSLVLLTGSLYAVSEIRSILA